jgi:beta-N-acetylhexosaminidase
MALGATASPALARRAGAAVGRGLRTLGFNMNLAPVLDVYSNPGSAIGTRSFGDSPEAVGALGAAFMEGQASEHVLSVAKHFVGEGAARGDSHEITPWVTATAAEVAARDLVPFRMAMDKGLSAVMTSHAAAPELTGEGGTPMTFSHNVVTGLLRNEMGFRGLVLTDVLEMAGARGRGDLGEMAVRAIEAGADMVLTVGSEAQREAVFRGLCDAYRTHRLGEERVRESLRRILAAKEALTAGPLSHVRPEGDIARVIAERSLTMLTGQSQDGDLRGTRKADILCIAPDGSLATLLAGRGVTVPKKMSLDEVWPRAAKIVQDAGHPRVLVGAFENRRQASVIERVSTALPSARLIAVSLGNPHDAELITHAAVVIAAYSSSHASQRAVARLLHGALAARGRLPIAMTAPLSGSTSVSPAHSREER